MIDTDTIFRGFKICEDEQIDGSLKAKLYARLIREYRRNLEHAKRQVKREQRHKDIEDYIQKRFPGLSPNNSLHILDQQKQGKRKPTSPYANNLDIEEEFKDEDASSGFYPPKIITSSDSTVGPNGKRQPKYPLRQIVPPNNRDMREVNLFEIEEVKSQRQSGRGRQLRGQPTNNKILSERIIMLPTQPNSSLKKIGGRVTETTRSVTGGALRPPVTARAKINHFASNKS